MAEARVCDVALAELRKLLADCKKNRLDVDPHKSDETWSGFIQGVGQLLDKS